MSMRKAGDTGRAKSQARRVMSAGVLAMIGAGLSGCAVSKRPGDYAVAANETTLNRETPDEIRGRLQSTPLGAEGNGAYQTAPSTSRTNVPKIGSPAQLAAADAGAPPPFGVETVEAVVPPLAVPDFVDLVFGQMLQTPYAPGPGVANNNQVIQLRTSGQMQAADFYSAITTALKQYGLRVYHENGLYQIVLDSALQSRLPRFVRSRARAETPAGLRPVVQFIELNAIRSEDMSDILRQAFDPREDNLRIEADAQSNYIILSGLPEDVDAALSIIYEMDELRYAGTQVQRYNPAYWGSSNLTREINRILTAEGWQTSLNETQQKAVLLLSVEQSNDIMVFSRTPEARARVNYWLTQLDRPARKGNEAQMFVYSAKNIDAQLLADTANNVLESMASSNSGNSNGSSRDRRRQLLAAAAAGQPIDRSGLNGDDGQSDAGAAAGRIVVDPYGNRLVFSGTASEYDSVLPLLEALDQPAAEVLIEVMIAQITLSDSITSGVEWAVDTLTEVDPQNAAGVFTGLSASQAGLGLGGGGLDIEIIPDSTVFGRENASISINAFAQNSQVNILSTRRLGARSGSTASVQVGSEVPVLTAQRLPTGAAGGDTNVDVISSVAYRSTGIILDIEPIVFSNDRIDLTITQEVSSQADSGGPINSPTFNNTNVSTSLSLADGATAVIGGLIQDQVSEAERGIPFVKDLPLIGKAFKVDEYSVDRTELVLLITAYVLRSQDDKAALAARMSSEIDRTLSTNNLVTLRPRIF